MASNAQEIIQDVHAQFEHLLDFITGEKAQTATADQVEQGLFNIQATGRFGSQPLAVIL